MQEVTKNEMLQIINSYPSDDRTALLIKIEDYVTIILMHDSLSWHSQFIVNQLHKELSLRIIEEAERRKLLHNNNLTSVAKDSHNYNLFQVVGENDRCLEPFFHGVLNCFSEDTIYQIERRPLTFNGQLTIESEW